VTNGTRGHRVAARWALVSKKPGAGGDYGVLAASDASAGEMAWRFAPGFPGHDAAPGDPWVTFGTHQDAGARFVSVAVQRAEAGSDQAGRAIWSRDFFAFGWQDTVRCNASYHGLYEAVTARAAEERVAGAPVSLEVRSQRLDELTAWIERFGFERLARIAAALLDGPVAVGGTARLRLAERIGLLDAVAALLPYGFRADLSASSAVSRISVPAMRLILAGASLDSHQAIDIGDTGSPVPLSATAREHLDMLLRKGQGSGVDRIVRHLWEPGGPSFFSRPADAVEPLRSLDHSFDLLSRLRGPTSVDFGLAYEFFAQGRGFVAAHWESLPDPSRDRLLELVLESRDRAADAELAQSWRVVFPEIVGLDNDELDHGRLDLAERSLAIAETAPGAGAADELLVHLLIPQATRGSGGGSWQRRMRARVRLLLARPVPRPGSFTVTRAALRWGEVVDWQAMLLVAMLSGELDRDPGTAGSRVAAWASWLSGPAVPQSEHRPDWVAALDFAAAARAPGSTEAGKVIQSVAAEAPGWAPVLIWLARGSERLPDVLRALQLEPGPEILRRVLEMTMPGEGARQDADSFRRAVTAALGAPLRPSGVPEDCLAYADAARLILGTQPCDFPQTGSKKVSRYLAGLTKVFDLLTGAAGPGWPARVQDGFLAAALPAVAATQEPLPRGAVELIKAWCADPARAPGLARHIDSSQDDVLVETLLRYDQLSPEEWRALAEYVPRMGALGSAAQLQMAVQRMIADPDRPTRGTPGFQHELGGRQLSVPASGLATAMYEARRDGMEIPQIFAVIGGTRHGDPPITLMDRVKPARLWEVLLQFQSLLLHQPLGGIEDAAGASGGTQAADPVRELIRCRDCIIQDQSLGAEYAQRFREMLADRYREDQRYQEFMTGRSLFGRGKRRPRRPEAGS
jgi:hypothetical protein